MLQPFEQLQPRSCVQTSSNGLHAMTHAPGLLKLHKGADIVDLHGNFWGLSLLLREILTLFVEVPTAVFVCDLQLCGNHIKCFTIDSDNFKGLLVVIVQEIT